MNRFTSLAEAFASAAARELKASHLPLGQALRTARVHWVARRVALDERPIGVVHEVERRPVRRAKGAR